jgi:hypothetical protein
MKAKAIVSDVLLLATLVQTFMQSSCHEIHYEGDEPKLIQPRDERTETLLSVIAGNIETLVAEKDRIRALLTVEEIDFLERIAELSDSGKLLDDYVKAESKRTEHTDYLAHLLLTRLVKSTQPSFSEIHILAAIDKNVQNVIENASENPFGSDADLFGHILGVVNAELNERKAQAIVSALADFVGLSAHQKMRLFDEENA